MRAAALVLALIGCALPALAASPVTIAALRQTLTEQEAAHKSDSAIAQNLSGLELTEELTAPTLKHIMADAHPGPQTAQALGLLADASALLAPPANEIPAAAQPDMAAQRTMFNAAVNYVVKTLRHLPDFLATRETRSFNDSPTVVGHSGYAPETAMHAVGTFEREITFRDGKEALEAEVAAAKKAPGPAGLTTWGEFGPVLAIMLTDSLKGRVTWSRWEDGANGRVAVFHYEVPKAASHYHVDFCCVWKGWNDVAADAGTSDAAYHGTPAYHGELYLDPASGTIQRVTLEADLGPTEVIRRAAISVEYGPVEIGGTSYICPTRSVAISQDMDRPGKTIGGELPLTRINETLFTGYHRFGSTSRILAGVPANPPPAGAEIVQRDAPAEATTTAPTPATSTATNAAPAEAEKADAAMSAMEPKAAPPVSDSPAPAPEASAQPVTNAAPPKSSTPATPVFTTTTRNVVLDVVVTKGAGGAMTGLRKQDFEVSEDGKAQAIDFFEEHSARSQTFDAPPAMPEMPADYHTNVPLPAPGDSVNVLLLDGLNTELQDQAYFYQKIMDFLKKMQPGTRVAIFTLGSKLRMAQGFTTDTSALIAAINGKRHGLMPEKISRSRSDDADEAEAVTNLQAMRASPYAIEALRDSQAGAGARDLAARATMTFQALDFLAHYLSGIPGRKNLIWFASSFPVVIFPTVKQRESIKQNPNMPGYMDQINTTADLFTAGKIAIYPIDASGVMTEHVAEADTNSPVPSPTGVGHIGTVAPDTNMSPYAAGAEGRAQVVSAMEQLAASTGGKAFYNSNDLNGAMQKAVDDGAIYYTLGYSPINKTMDGSFRRIDVRVVASGKYKLAYRRGYNAEERPAADAQAAVNPLAALLEYGLPGATGVLYGAAVKAGLTEEASTSNRAGASTSLQGMVTRYRVDFTIRAGDVELKPNAQGGRSGRILIGLKVYDRDGNAVNWEGDDQSLDLKESDYGALVKNGIPAHLMIDLPANVQGQLVTAVYDWNSGRAGTLNVPIGVGNSR